MRPNTKHPEGVTPLPVGHRWLHAEDEALLSLLDEHTTMSKGVAHVNWAALEEGMAAMGMNHSLGSLKKHAHKLQEAE